MKEANYERFRRQKLFPVSHIATLLIANNITLLIPVASVHLQDMLFNETRPLFQISSLQRFTFRSHAHDSAV